MAFLVTKGAGMISMQAVLCRWEQWGCTEPREPPLGLQPLGFRSSAPSLSPWEQSQCSTEPLLISALGHWASHWLHPTASSHHPTSVFLQGKPAQVLLFVWGANDLSTRQSFSRHIPLSSEPMDFFGDWQRSPLKHVSSPLSVSCQNTLSFFWPTLRTALLPSDLILATL